MLEERIATQLSEDHHMSHREYEVLVRLDGAGGRLRMSDIATQMVASPPLITQTIRRLEERKWVRREAASDDKRGVETVITAAGSRGLANASGPHADLIRIILLDIIGDSEMDMFAGAVKRVADHLRNHRAGIACESSNCPLNM